MAAFSPVRGCCQFVRLVRHFRSSSKSKTCFSPPVRLRRTFVKSENVNQCTLGVTASLNNLMNCQSRSLKTSSGIFSSSPVIEPGKAAEVFSEPYILTKDDLKDVFFDIKQELNSCQEELKQIVDYYFDAQGKALRLMLVVLMSRAINTHLRGSESELMVKQRQIAMIAEMIHNASLIHDDVIDMADTRRGKPSASVIWGQKKAVLAGDYILSIASGMLAKVQNNDVTLLLSQVLADLVQGEFMQLGSKTEENERFAHYLLKTFKKTASLIAHSCKAVAVLAGGDSSVQELAFQYGRNVGIAFQLIDDTLDFVSTSITMGKPAIADLRLGLATAPVLFACEQQPELNAMIMRRFSQPDDVEKAYEAVLKSDGIEQTRFLAQKHCLEAIRLMNQLAESPEQRALVSITDLILNRNK